MEGIQLISLWLLVMTRCDLSADGRSAVRCGINTWPRRKTGQGSFEAGQGINAAWPCCEPAMWNVRGWGRPGHRWRCRQKLPYFPWSVLAWSGFDLDAPQSVLWALVTAIGSGMTTARGLQAVGPPSGPSFLGKTW